MFRGAQLELLLRQLIDDADAQAEFCWRRRTNVLSSIRSSDTPPICWRLVLDGQQLCRSAAPTRDTRGSKMGRYRTTPSPKRFRDSAEAQEDMSINSNA